jgi:ribosomal protein L11 methyltransferase
MIYRQFHVLVPEENIFSLEEFLGDTIESMWWDEKGNVTGIVAIGKLEMLMKQFAHFFSQLGLGTPSIHIFEMEDLDWLEEDQKNLEPLEVGNFFIYPPHFNGKIPKDKKGFKIDSPHAFGSGHHETTKTCLKALQELSKTFQVSKAVDVGCGSGILALAIAWLWKIPVQATDCDPSSVFEARNNILVNGMKEIEVVECSGLENESISKKRHFDLIVANIHSDILKELSGSIEKSLSPQGKILLSGILNEQEEEVVSIYESLGMKLDKTYHDGQWSTLLFKNEDAK